ncbi:11258_t:CDS:1, partial [Funneliformis mosseae]
YKSQNLQIEKSKEKTSNKKTNENLSKEEVSHEKRTYRKTSENEKKILEKILNYNTFPENEAFNILNQLQSE